VGFLSSDGRVTSTSVYGTTYYTFDSDLNDVVFHADVVPLNSRQRIFVHYVGYRDIFYSSEFRGMRSTSSVSNTAAIYVSNFATPPTDEQLRTVRLRFTRTRSCEGTGYYTRTSDLATVAFHMNLLLPGETKTFYVLDLGLKTDFYRSTNRGVVCTSSFLSSRAITLTTGSSPPSVYGSAIFPVTLTATRIACNTLWGVGIYTRDSDLTCMAQHMGLLDLERFTTVWLQPMGLQSIFRKATIFECTSSVYTTSYQSITLTTDSTPRAPVNMATTPYAVNITMDNTNGASDVRARRVFPRLVYQEGRVPGGPHRTRRGKTDLGPSRHGSARVHFILPLVHFAVLRRQHDDLCVAILSFAVLLSAPTERLAFYYAACKPHVSQLP
jgi:hypothetical protein